MYFAGASRMDVTPPVGYRLQGHYSRQQPSEKIHDRLFLKVLSLSDGVNRVVLVTSDLIEYSREFVEKLRVLINKETGLLPQYLFLSASHTHTGPHMLDDLPIGVAPIPGYLDMLAKVIVGGVKAAIHDEESVTLFWGKGAVGIGINRRKKTAQGVMFMADPAGPVDEEVGVLCVNRLDRTPKAILFNYACHPTTLGGDIFQISADYPGVAQREIERMYASAMVMFANGCGGDVKTADLDRQQFAGGSFRDIERIGRVLAAEAIKCVEQAHPLTEGKVDGLLKTIALPLNKELIPADLRMLNESYACYQKICGFADDLEMWRTHLENKLKSGEKLVHAVDVDLQAIRFGDLVILGLSGEVMVEIGLKIKRQIHSRLMVCAYVNGACGYIPTSSAIGEGGYETISFIFNRIPAPYSDDMENVYIRNALDIIREISEK